jgi:hypothetical protein
MLQACEDQTTTYDWHKQLIAISAMLDMEETDIFETIPPAIFKGLMSMLPLAQRFPEDRYIVVETPRGICSIVAWAFLLLGIPILVRIHKAGEYEETRFPPDNTIAERILVDVRTHIEERYPNEEPILREPTISLLSTSTREELFRLKADPDEDIIDSTFKRPARGLAEKILEKELPQRPGRDRVINEIGAITCSFALLIAKKLSHAMPDVAMGPDETEYFIEEFEEEGTNSDAPGEQTRRSDNIPRPPPYHTSQESIFESGCLLFNITGSKFPRKTISDYTSLYQGRDLYGIEQPPSCLKQIFSDWGLKENIWSRLRHAALQLSVLVFGLRSRWKPGRLLRDAFVRAESFAIKVIALHPAASPDWQR